jgi:hypothetical protein
MWLEALAVLLLLTALLLVWALWRSRNTAKQLRAMEEDLRRAQAAGHEQAARIAALETLRDTQKLAEHAIATGTAVVKEVHKGIADIPFGVLESIPGARVPAKALRGLHDAISDGVYGALGNLNKAVGRELRKGVPLGAPTEAMATPVLPATPSAAPTPPALQPPEDDEPPEPPKKSWG